MRVIGLIDDKTKPDPISNQEDVPASASERNAEPKPVRKPGKSKGAGK
ncbi:MAG: hypothetical protein IJ899_00460 [Blautia sp.]|nr:hypothetical protein [Blautia sp.]